MKPNSHIDCVDKVTIVRNTMPVLLRYSPYSFGAESLASTSFQFMIILAE